MMCANCFRFGGDLGDAVGSAAMIRRRHGDFGAPGEGGLGDAEVVRRDDQVIQFLRAPASLPDMLQQRFSRDRMERLSRENASKPSALE